jgi:hypothetical protein
MCLTKQSHETLKEAMEELFRLQEEEELYDLAVYRCPLCTKFHIGHKTRKK